MALQTSFILTGDASGAEQALDKFDSAMDGAEKNAAQLAQAYDKVDRSIEKVAGAQARAKQQTDQTRAAYKAGEISLEQYNRELLETKTALGLVEKEHRDTVNALRASDEALNRSGVSVRQARAGYVNFGRQIQDVAVMAQMPGVNLGSIIALQGAQVADAVSQMGGRFSGFASFLAGPWGAAVFVGASMLANLVDGLWEAEEAAKAAEVGADALGAAQSALGGIFDLTSGRIKAQNELLIVNAQLTAMNLRKDALEKEASSRSTLADAQTANPSFFELQANDLQGVASSSGNNAASVRGMLELVEAGVLSNRAALRQIESMDLSGTGVSRTELAQAVVDKLTAERNREMADLIEQSLESGQLAPELRREGNAPRSRTRSSSNAAERELKKTAEFGKRAAEQIARINERFGEQPQLLSQAAQATRQLDDIVADLSKRKPEGFEGMIASAGAARQAIEQSLLRPFNDLIEASRRQEDIGELILAGREDEARALEQIYQLQDRVGQVTEDQRRAILDNVRAERELNEALAQRQELIAAYSGSIGTVRNDLEALLSGKAGAGDFLSSFKDNIAGLQGKLLTEQLFGPMLRELDDYVRQNTGIATGVDIMQAGTEKAGQAATDLAETMSAASARIDGLIGGRAANDNSGARGSTSTGFAAAFAPFARNATANTPDRAQQETADNTDEIVVSARRLERGVAGIDPDAFLDKLTLGMANTLTDQLDNLFGVEFFGQLSGAFAGAMKGYFTGGETGAVLGGVQGLLDGEIGDSLFGGALNKSIAEGLAKGLSGAKTGSNVAMLSDALGLGGSREGAQIGGAIGGMTGIPGGDIIGSILGSVVGSLFGNVDDANLGVTGIGGRTQARGELLSNVQTLADTLDAGLLKVADALGAQIGSFSVSIGQREDYFRVGSSASFDAGAKRPSGALYNGTDPQAALAAAFADAIGDGAITGVSEAVQTALKSSKDIEAGLEEALKVRDIEKLLAGPTDALAQALSDFESVAAERLSIARKYGLDVVALEKRNAADRLALTDQLLAGQVGSLQDLITRMTSGDLFEGSAVDRRDALLGEIDLAKAAAQAGQDGAADRLAELLEQLNRVSEEVYGTTGGFANDNAFILDSARDVIAAANQRISDAQKSSDPALATTNAALDENNDQNARMLAEQKAMNAWLEQIARNGGSGDDYAALARLARTS
ncbi:hypothetical protein D2V17_14190 [Aurantiacibacter xanthus]|uniref:Bacteriophage tail tape measure N-terminal domain-containing protein n=1 Tax=Aurantiacibacter xanthus TaxID=1784712 RepID=A0A3A1P367_9SPHN|nr:hypothetical protein [Aurantiacibacter xanthus]RIV82948.1 hypothetical protein D2V17_14190 [Aurantiacibacter xanthus]